MRSTRRVLTLASLVSTACATGGSAWMEKPLVEHDAPWRATATPPSTSPSPPSPSSPAPSTSPATAPLPLPVSVGGTPLGVFRNTYYDFPVESDYSGAPVPLMSSSCSPIASVPRGFYESVCMQGSGLLRGGRAVSFARRDCACAEVCPRSGQQICFEALDPHRFPWGRGATGRAITPLVTVAADTHVLPLGTRIYIAEFDGVARTADSTERLDGCFVVEDRGVRIQGAHVDVFAGDEASTAYLNTVVPSNAGVTVSVDVPKCAAR